MSAEDQEKKVIEEVAKRLETNDENRKDVQSEIERALDDFRKKLDALQEELFKNLQVVYTKEDDTFQELLFNLNNASSDELASMAIKKAKAELRLLKSYSFDRKEDILQSELVVKKEIASLDEVQPRASAASLELGKARVVVESGFNAEEERVLDENGFTEEIVYKASVAKKGSDDAKEYDLERDPVDDGGTSAFSFVPELIEPRAVYTVKVKAAWKDKESKWGEESEFTAPDFSGCVWKECSDNVNEEFKYSADEDNPKIATKDGDGIYSAVIGNTSLPLDKVASWSIKILWPEDNNGYCLYVGVAPSDIDQNGDYHNLSCGWYFRCYDSKLTSGLPHNYEGKEYGPRKERGEYVRTGDSVGVVMDTAKGELSFSLNGESLGVAYEGIPLDKPLVPCVLLRGRGDSVELVI